MKLALFKIFCVFRKKQFGKTVNLIIAVIFFLKLNLESDVRKFKNNLSEEPIIKFNDKNNNIHVKKNCHIISFLYSFWL